MSKFENVQLRAFEVARKGVKIHNERQIRGDKSRQIFFDYMDEVNKTMIEMSKAYVTDVSNLSGKVEEQLQSLKAAFPYLRDIDEDEIQTVVH